ncbi:hypothetical protein INT43_003941 [Umbelopsis isabellina]|uniref:Transcription factor domain-containing protein n=1 Tax=Mortierella isabellina TaxID=91625 RepID=A0A8H7PTY1_MORIS|nr:hypothetical protein INT43_003941 [Umbelopsis isabellina]
MAFLLKRGLPIQTTKSTASMYIMPHQKDALRRSCVYDEKANQTRRQSSQPAVQQLPASVASVSSESERRLSTSSDKQSDFACQCDYYKLKIRDLEAHIQSLETKLEWESQLPKHEGLQTDRNKQTQSAGQEKSANPRKRAEATDIRQNGAEPSAKNQSSCNISFANDLYAYIRSHPPSVRANQARAYISDTRLPPLLFDFYNLSSQPHTIWIAFVNCMRTWSRQRHQAPAANKIEHTNKLPLTDNLSCEMLKLHTSHNYLYSSFIDTSKATSGKQPSTNWLSKLSDKPFFKTQTAASGCDETMLVYAIFANVLLSASQSLSISSPDIAEISRQGSEGYYHQAHRIFTSNVFPASHPAHPAEPTMEQLAILTKTSVLLTHYQCATISEEHAFLTFKIGLTFAERLGLHKLSSSSMHNIAIDQVKFADDDSKRLWISSDKVNDEECERLENLWKVMRGWDIWFAVYLDRPPMVESTDAQSSQPLASLKRMDPRDWAVRVVEAYTDNMRSMSQSLITSSCSQLKSMLDNLKAWSSSFITKQGKSGDKSATESAIHLSASILSLYHDILTIQLFRSRALPALKVFGDAAGWVPSKHKSPISLKRRLDTEPESPTPVANNDSGKHDPKKDKPTSKKADVMQQNGKLESSDHSEVKMATACCTMAARSIVETATRIITTHRHCAGAPLVLYPLCLAGTVLLWQYHQRSRMGSSAKLHRKEIVDQESSEILISDDFDFNQVLISFKALTKDISTSFPVAEPVLLVLDEMLGSNNVAGHSPDPSSIGDTPMNDLNYVVSQASQNNHQQQIRQMNMMLQPDWMPEFQPDGMIDMNHSLMQDPMFPSQRHPTGPFPPPNYTHMDMLNLSRGEMDREALGKLDRDYRDNATATNAYTNQSAHMLVLSSQLPMNFAMGQPMYEEQMANFGNKKTTATAREAAEFTSSKSNPGRSAATSKSSAALTRQMWLQQQRQQQENGQFPFEAYSNQMMAHKNASKKSRVDGSYEEISDTNGDNMMKHEFATFAEMAAAEPQVDFVYPSDLNSFLISDQTINHQNNHAAPSDPMSLQHQPQNNVAYSQRAQQQLSHQRSVSQDTPPTTHPYISNTAMASTPHTKLPLPAPKQTYTIQKSWPTTTSSREYVARFNVVETLHPAHPINTSDVPYIGANLVDPNTMSVVPPQSSPGQQQGLTDQHQEVVMQTF